MPYYDVTASVTFLGSITVEADSPEEALENAREYDASAYDCDPFTGEVDFNVTPGAVLVS